MSFKGSTTNRCWMVTLQIGNMEKAGLTKEQYENPEFLADFFIDVWEKSGKGRRAGIAVCVSAKGCYHAHMACYGNTTTLKKVSDILYNAHVEPQLGGKGQLAAYLSKTGKYAEKGEQVLFSKGLDVVEDNQGNRSDLEVIEEMLDNGATPTEIFETSFRFRRYEKMIKDDYLARRIRSTPVIKKMWNEYHFGDSGTGKTYTYAKLCQTHSVDDVYLCSDYANSGGSGGGFDFYANNPAKIIVLDEFRGCMPYSTLLSLLDVYSRNQQHCRYQNTYNLWESVIICSILPPEKVYERMVSFAERNTDNFKQFMRRLNKIVYHYKSGDEYKTYEMLPDEYVCADDMKRKAMASEISGKIEDLGTEINTLVQNKKNNEDMYGIFGNIKVVM